MKTIYLFEDSENDSLSRLFKQGFKAKMVDNFKYANGNNNLINVAKELLKDKDTQLIIFVDLVPNNARTALLFNKLCVLANEDLHRVFIVPSMGSEYYFLKSIKDKGITKNNDIMAVYYNVERYVDKCKPVFDTVKLSLEKYSTFERLGKRLIEHNYTWCISHPKLPDASYYDCDCRCIRPNPADCSHKCFTLTNKAEDLLMGYDLIPIGSIVDNQKDLIGFSAAFDIVEKYLVWVTDKAKNEFKLTKNMVSVYEKSIELFNKLRRDWYA